MVRFNRTPSLEDRLPPQFFEELNIYDKAIREPRHYDQEMSEVYRTMREDIQTRYKVNDIQFRQIYLKRYGVNP